MEKLKNTPSLRFPEFNRKWEEKKIGDYYKKLRTGMTPYRGIPEYYTGNILWIASGELNYGKITDTKEKITERAVEETNLEVYPPNTLFIAITGLEAPGTRGKCAINLLPATTNQSCMAFDKKENVDTYFLFYWYQRHGTSLYFKYAQGTKQQSFNNALVERFDFIHPTITEQTKIASFLTAIDDKLQALKQKKTLLEEYKKGMMQKIFSQEIRFKDDNGNEYPDWEFKKLGEIFYSEKGKGISKNKIVPHGNFECVLYGELYTKYNEVIYKVVSKTNEVDGIKSKVGDLLIPSSTTTTGIDLANVTALNKNDVLLGGDITVLRSNNEINNVFYAYYLSNHKKEEIASYAQGSTIVHLYYNHIKDMEIHLLSLSEQTKIANFLSAIDDKIKHCQSQIEKTEDWKKGLLQQMFV
jgi:type I restriction enzyme S subunit